MSENVRVYLIDRAGTQANAFADKLAGREGIELVGGAADVDEALEEIIDGQPDVVLVGTDVGGTGVVAAVERVLSLASEMAVVALCTRADKALVDAAVRVGAAGSLDRAASDIDTVTALHTYRDRQHGVHVDMALAEPPAERQGLRVSGALPRFPTPETPEISYLNERPMIGASQETEPAPVEPETEAQPELVPAPPDPAQPGAEAGELGQSSRPAGMNEDLQQMREMLRGEATAAHGSAPKPKRRGLFGRRKEKSADTETPWGPRDGQDEETESS